MNSSVRINKSFDITVSTNKSIPSERKLALEVKPKMYLSYPSADEKKNIQVEIIDFKKTVCYLRLCENGTVDIQLVKSEPRMINAMQLGMVCQCVIPEEDKALMNEQMWNRDDPAVEVYIEARKVIAEYYYKTKKKIDKIESLEERDCQDAVLNTMCDLAAEILFGTR